MTNPYVAQMRQWRQTLTKDQRWAILISADPDALASALALKRIMAHRVRGVDIFRINEVTRPDNLAMIRYLRIPAKLWQPEKADLYTNFAMVDSQPHHNPAFQGITFDLIIDHHPLTAGQLPQAPFCDIRPGFGATSTMMTRYLQGLRIKPGPLLSTALLYGIRTDTATFERSGGVPPIVSTGSKSAPSICFSAYSSAVRTSTTAAPSSIISLASCAVIL